MLVAVFSQFFQLRDGVSAFLQSQALVTDLISQCPVVVRGAVELLRFALLLYTLVLEEQFALPDIFRFFDDSVFDCTEFFLL